MPISHRSQAAGVSHQVVFREILKPNDLAFIPARPLSSDDLIEDLISGALEPLTVANKRLNHTRS
jgi:hypothetical protein